MTKERKQEITDTLMKIYEKWEPPEYLDPMESNIHMYDLMLIYLEEYGNKERISGAWVIENCPEPLKSLPA